MKKIAIHQPNFMPWMGYFKKIQSADQFVFLDHVAFSKGSYTNRVRIHSADDQSSQWLTIPIKKHTLGTRISEIEIDRSKDLEDYLLSKIKNTYKHSVAFDDLFPKMEQQIERMSSIDSLSQYNIQWIEFISNALDIQIAGISSSFLMLEKSDKQVVLQICKHLDAEIYVSGMGGKSYIDEIAFADSEIKVEYSNFSDICNRKGIDQSLVGMSSISWLFLNQKTP